MLKHSRERRLDMTLLNPNGTIRVNDSRYFGSEDPLDWRYNFCYSFEENEKRLLQLVYGDKDVEYTASEELSRYLEDRKSVYEKIKPYHNILKAISEAEIPASSKENLLTCINLEIHRMYPYEKTYTN